jgi:hypothetical protein
MSRLKGKSEAEADLQRETQGAYARVALPSMLWYAMFAARAAAAMR